mmetsp:Transcript_5676/g.10763  ORF Transcript_5676/g.10763 Transcript_5676/m.10763 type:complete len:183 (-) Transcript_5676:77-625(-)
MNIYFTICSILSTAAATSGFFQHASIGQSYSATPTKKTNTPITLHATPIGPMARLKKMQDPEEYNRVIEQKIKRSKMTREEAEADYNQFLENPPFYYALEKKEEYYKSLGYKDIFEGMIGEAVKEGKGDEMRQRIAKFRLQSKIKAATVLITAIVVFFWVQTIYNADPEHFLKGGLPDYSRR